LAASLIAAACSSDNLSPLPEQTGPAAPEWLVERAAGGATTFEVSDRSYNLSARNVGLEARIRFADGDRVFERFFTEADGLGPNFNADGCNACHFNNGRQEAPLADGYVGIGPVVHVSARGATETQAPLALPGYGTRLQTYATNGAPEAQVNLLWVETPGTYPDGATYSLRHPQVSIIGRDGMLPADAEVSLRIPPPVAGPGMLEFVPAADIEAGADPDDLDGNGISGRVQWSPDEQGGFRIGRHGWKAENFDLTHQSAGALAEDSGIGTNLFPVEGLVELNDIDLADLAFYVEALAIPAGRDIDDPDVIAGANLFDTVGCADCHTPEQRTGVTNAVELDNLVIYPFTDLLLHDLGEGLDDGRPVLRASGAEWRTSALWGIGLSEVVNGHYSLLHDGRARSIEEAILWHGGEASPSTDAFKNLDAADRAKLIRFVQSR